MPKVKPPTLPASKKGRKINIAQAKLNVQKAKFALDVANAQLREARKS